MMTDPHILGFGEIEVDGFNLKSLGYGANSFVFEVKNEEWRPAGFISQSVQVRDHFL